MPQPDDRDLDGSMREIERDWTPGGPSVGHSLSFLQDFSLSDPAAEDGSALAVAAEAVVGETVRRADRPPLHSGPRGRHLGVRGPGAAPVASRSRSLGGVPGEGDVLSGFRILHELGRGAFARVYLAEEIRLGGRLVAIKVSRAEGDEPRILARLQHANIVPVHSVHDDPATGLRVLCMPFFGGANLAQVLDTAGGLCAAGRSGHSLVDALDRISVQHPSAASQSPRLPSGRPRSSSVAGDGPASNPVPVSEPAAIAGSAGSSLAVGFRSPLGRIIGAGVVPPILPAGPDPVRDPHQPARLYLQRATAVEAAAWIVARLAEGLDHAHARGLLHRDLKPANVLLASDGTPMLLDFNLSAESGPRTLDGEIGRAMLGGTLPYMAPEHLDAFDPRGTTAADAVDARADIYAMGLILFEILAGEHPFRVDPPPGSSASELIRPMIEARRHPPSLRARNPEVPWSLDAVVAKCLAFDPARRYAHARDLAEDLRRFLDDLPMKHAPEPSLRERIGKFGRRHRALCGSTSVAIAAIIIIAAMASGVAVVYSGVQGLIARFHRQAFERSFTEAQFLLNTADASDRHLEAGLIAAQSLLGRLELPEQGDDPAAPWFRGLTDAERRRAREQIVELTLLEARARVLLASRRGLDFERMAAIRRAVAQLDRAERIAETVPAALYNERSRYHSALGDHRLADRDRRLAATARPASSHDWTLLAVTLLAANDDAGAEDALRQALRLDCTSFWAWFMMGHCHYAQGRFLEAAGDFAACSAVGSQFAWVHFNRGLALARSGRLDPARDAYDQALLIDPGFAEAMVNRALVELELDQLDPALADLTMAIRLGRDDAGVLAARGETLARLGRPDEARRLFDELLNSEPENVVARVARGMTRLRSDPSGARDDFDRVLRREPRQAAAHYGMAFLIRADDPRAALDHLGIAIESDPNLVDAIQLRALVRGRLGDPAALDDVDRLLKAPTARRYYNAACAVALYADKAHDPRQLSHALELLTRAAELGFPVGDADEDPDLAPLRPLPGFRSRLGKRDGTTDKHR